MDLKQQFSTKRGQPHKREPLRQGLQTLKGTHNSARWRFIAHLHRRNGNYKTNVIIKHSSSGIVQGY